jgi:hypothetical protein
LELIAVRIYTKSTKNKLNSPQENDRFIEISNEEMFVLCVGIKSWNNGAAFEAHLDFAEAIQEKRINRHKEVEVIGLLIGLVLYLEITFVYLNAISVLDHLATVADSEINENLN